jgi:PIN domain nuclease of toxin-antitoxin system
MHSFLWWSSNSRRLSRSAFDALADWENDIWLSVVGVWEIEIKSQLGKMGTQRPVEEMIAVHQEQNDLNVLGVSLSHVLALRRLPSIHRSTGCSSLRPFSKRPRSSRLTAPSPNAACP